jgi:acetyl esterase
MQQLALSKGIEPTTRKFLETVNASKGPAIYQIPVEDGRQVFSKLQETAAKKPAVSIEDHKIPVGPSGSVNIRIVRPEGSTQMLPVLIYSHGAGWVFGGTDTHDRLIRDLSVGAQCAIVFVDYSRSPEAKYPTAIEEIYAAAKHVAEHAKDFNLDASKFAVAGDSVGGNMTAALTMMIKERGGPKVAAQVLFYPVTDANFDTQSYREFATNHFLTLDAMKWFWDQYTTDPAKRKGKLASPLQATVDDLKGLPRALVITGEFDVLRDEGEAYAHKLTEAGVHVTAVRFLGTIHDFVLLNALAETPATRLKEAFAS